LELDIAAERRKFDKINNRWPQDRMGDSEPPIWYGDTTLFAPARISFFSDPSSPARATMNRSD
jgi:hypothetical protein